jgi:membrane protease YdiL (CAAX protease family)
MPESEPPLVTRPEDAIPTVLPVAPTPPRPGLFESLVLTVGFAVVLFGTIVLIFFVAWLGFLGDADPIKTPPGKTVGIGDFDPRLTAVLAWSFPLGYAAGLAYALVVARAVVGRGWHRQLGLHRLSYTHVWLGVVALPAFSVLSDGLALVLFRAFGMDHLLDQGGQLGQLFAGFPAVFVFVAIGVGPGVVEELWCRGVLGRGLVGRYGWVSGVLSASLVFGLLHLFPPPYVVVTAVMGACLHFGYGCSRSLWVPIVMHTLNNGFAGLAAVGVVPVGGMERAMANAPAVVYPLALVVMGLYVRAAWGARARAAGGPPGACDPPAGVTYRDGNPVAAVALAVASAALVTVFVKS